MSLTPKQRDWCEEWNVSPRLVEAISDALAAVDETHCTSCGEMPCRCQLDEFPFGLESTEVAEQFGMPSAASTPSTTGSSDLSADAKKERKLRDKAEKAVSDDIRLPVNRKKDKVVMYPSTDAPN